MAKSKTLSTKVTIQCNPGRNLSDDGWDDFAPADINLWKSANLLLSAYSYHHLGCQIELKIDWRPVTRRLQHNSGVMAKLLAVSRTPATFKLFDEFRNSPVKVTCAISAETQRKKSLEHLNLEAFVKCFVYDVFLITNLSVPGSYDLYGSTMRSKAKKYSANIALSSYWFEAAYLNIHDRKWPAPIVIPLEDVRQWYCQIRNSASQIPSSRIEKVLFGFWHICATDLSSNTIVWLFYALETLFDTKPGENIRTLQARICLLLSTNDNESKILRKSLRAMYDLRSAFVHGGLEVIHPMHDEGLDPNVDEKYERLVRTCEFGFSVLLRSIQEVITRKWREPYFCETLQGHPAMP